MKRIKMTATVLLALMFTLAIVLPSTVFAQAYRPYTNTIELTVQNVPTFESGLGLATSGDEWFVDSNASGTAAGTSWTNACLTTNACYDLASSGDLIRVSETHAETCAAANCLDMDTEGITIQMMGNGANAPLFTFTATGSTIACGAANNTLIGGRYLAGVSAVAIGIALEDACDNFTFSEPVFPEPTTAAFEFVDAIDLASGVDGFTLIHPIQFTVDQAGAAHFLEMGNGVNNNIKIYNVDLYGEYSVSAIWSDTTDLEVEVAGGVITNLTNGEHAIEFVTGTALGTIRDILVRTDAQGTAVDPGSMTLSNVLWDDDAVTDSVSIPVVAGGPETQGLADIHLDHVMALDGATSKFPEQAVEDSTICKILGDDDPAVCTTYDNSTDSLEAIGNLVTDANQEANSDASLVTIHMDHLMALDGATSKFPEQAVEDSTICKMLGDDDPAVCTTYDNSTDSLEAIGNLVADANQQTNNDTSLATIHLDHYMALDGATSKFPEQAVEDSALCKMLGDDDPAVCTTYDNSTDSLEALGNLVADANQQTNNDTSLASQHLDHLMALDGATSKFPETAVEDSTICKILGDDDPAVCTTYDNSTDSLEAIGNLVADANQQTNNDTSLASQHLDHLMALDGATSKFPETAVEDSTICKILGDDDPAVCTTYDNSTDSLEAISNRMDTQNTADQVDLDAILDYAEKPVSGSTAVMVNGDTIFTIAGGPIEIMNLVSICITSNDGTGSTLQYSADPTVGGAITISAASATLANFAAGGAAVINMTALNTAVDLSVVAVALGPVQANRIIVNEGIITIVIGTGSTTGTWKHYLRYRPLGTGVTVTGT